MALKDGYLYRLITREWGKPPEATPESRPAIPTQEVLDDNGNPTGVRIPTGYSYTATRVDPKHIALEITGTAVLETVL